uniref:Uncharacterized protein n=1 Tax=Arundo donax TaxID=35708 RepID=A0A0A9A3T8_ARUDO
MHIINLLIKNNYVPCHSNILLNNACSYPFGLYLLGSGQGACILVLHTLTPHISQTKSVFRKVYCLNLSIYNL